MTVTQPLKSRSEENIETDPTIAPAKRAAMQTSHTLSKRAKMSDSRDETDDDENESPSDLADSRERCKRHGAASRAEQTDEDDSSEYEESNAPQGKARLKKKPKLMTRRQDSDNGEDDAEDNFSDDDDDGTKTRVAIMKRQMEASDAQKRRAVAAAKDNADDELNTHDGKSGIISRIELFNFMNHSQVTLDLGPRINFLTGHNGSGKSAVLTALTVCLGGKAAATNRGGSIRELVKNDMQNGSIVVTLMNEGPDAYMPELYPGRIFVERKFTREGTSMYSIKGIDPQVWAEIKDKSVKKYGVRDLITRAKTKEELLAITDHFNLQIDNPLNILSQDDARAFLNTSSAAEKYSFFMSGTLLGQLAEDYSLIKEKLDTIVKQCLLKKKLLPQVEKAMKSAVKKVNDMKALRDMHNVVQGLKRELVWALVKDVEDEAHVAEKRVEEAETRIPDMKQQIEDFDMAIRPMDEAIEEMRTRVTDIGQQAQPLMQRRNDLNGDISDKKAEQVRMKNEASHLNTKAFESRSHKASLEEQIKLEKNRLASQDSEDSRRVNLMAQLNSVESRIKKQKNRHEDVAKLMSDIEGRKHILSEREKDCSSEIMQARSSLHSLDQRKSHLAAARANKDAQFGTFIPQILREIENLHQRGAWDNKPVGPVGAYITLKDRSFGATVENVLGSAYSNFVVTTDRDRKTLQGIVQRYNSQLKDHFQQSSVWFIHGFTPGQFRFNPAQMPDDQYNSIVKILNVSNELVLRALVDIHRIEAVLLFGSRQECEQLTGNRIPRNAKAMMDKEAHSLGSRGGHRQIQSSGRLQACRLTVDITAELQSVTVQVSEMQRQLATLQQHASSMQEEQRSLQSEFGRLRLERDNISRTLNELERSKSDLLDSLKDDEPTTLPVLENNLASVAQECEYLTESYEAMTSRLLSVRKETQRMCEDMKEIENRLQALQDESTEAKIGLKELEKQKSQALEQRRKFEETVRLEQEKVAQAEQLAEKARRKLKDTIVKANQYCERVVPSAKAVQLDRQIKASEETLRRRENEMGSLEDAVSEANSRVATYRRAVDEIKVTETFNLKLKRAHDLRVERWNEYRDIITLRTQSYFQMQLSRRNFTGRLRIDHDQHKMELKVQTNSGEANSTKKKKDPKSLSGGEKSYSQLCLLLAIWQAMESPLRCLDEFDVYMDAANRSICIAMLMESASVQGQYILITPQGMGAANIGPGVKLLKMADPIRGQTTLGNFANSVQETS